jgi:hypothetical protein
MDDWRPPTGSSAATRDPGWRAARLLDRVDAVLATFPTSKARRRFLDQQIEAWERRYSRFLASEGALEIVLHPADPPQAADFLLTIAGLARRRGAFTRSSEESEMLDLKRRQRIEHAIRTVLVAADQRCPAIIGQAHVLYHGAMGGSRCDVEQALRQLRLEAEHLLKSIADTEPEMSAARSEF